MDQHSTIRGSKSRAAVTALLLIVIACSNTALLQAQVPTNPLLIEQHYYAGVSVGLFDGFTTTPMYGAHFGWVGPTKMISPVGGMSPEVAFAVQYIPRMHLERVRYIPDAIVKDAVVGSVVAGPRFGGQLGFRTLIGLEVASGKAPLARCQANTSPDAPTDRIFLLSAEDGKPPASAAASNVLTADSACGKNNRRFPFISEIGPDLQLRKFRITLPLLITRFGDAGTRTQYSFRIGVDFKFGSN